MLEDGSIKLLQGVREIFEFIDPKEDSKSDEAKEKHVLRPKNGKLVFIGRRLDEKVHVLFDESLKSALG